MQNTTVQQNNEPTEANVLLHETKPTQMVVPLKVTGQTWTIEFPFLEEELQLSQIYELYPNQKTNPSVETKTGV
jgi:hypothetical protein